jgi:hypothetical protein
LAYDGPGTDAGNEWKITKKVEAYDEDAKLSVDLLMGLETCNGRVGATGECCSIPPNKTSMMDRAQEDDVLTLHRHVSRRSPRLPLRT